MTQQSTMYTACAEYARERGSKRAGETLAAAAAAVALATIKSAEARGYAPQRAATARGQVMRWRAGLAPDEVTGDGVDMVQAAAVVLMEQAMTGGDAAAAPAWWGQCHCDGQPSPAGLCCRAARSELYRRDRAQGPEIDPECATVGHATPSAEDEYLRGLDMPAGSALDDAIAEMPPVMREIADMLQAGMSIHAIARARETTPAAVRDGIRRIRKYLDGLGLI